jgi:hypothetical protein
VVILGIAKGQSVFDGHLKSKGRGLFPLLNLRYDLIDMHLDLARKAPRCVIACGPVLSQIGFD